METDICKWGSGEKRQGLAQPIRELEQETDGGICSQTFAAQKVVHFRLSFICPLVCFIFFPNS